MRKVEIAAGHFLVALPDGWAYNEGDQAILTDDEFMEIRPELFPDTIIDLGPVTAPSGGTVVETTQIIITHPSTDFLVAPPSGTPADGQHLLMKIKTGPVGFTPTWSAIYTSSGSVPLPTGPLPPNKTITLGFNFDSAIGKWVLLALDLVGY